jgi:hypothetical protein
MHEQAHWLLMQRHKGQAREMLPELLRMSNIRNQAASRRQAIGHFVYSPRGVMLEWQALEDLIGVQPARVVMEFKWQDRHKDLYADNNRPSRADRIISEVVPREVVLLLQSSAKPVN